MQLSNLISFFEKLDRFLIVVDYNEKDAALVYIEV